MNDVIAAVSSYGDDMGETVAVIIAYLPKLGLAVAVFFLGWVIAKFSRLLIKRAIKGLDSVWQPVAARLHLEPIDGVFSPSIFIGELIFWGMIFIFVLAAADVLGLDVFRLSMAAVLAYIPVLAGAALLVFVGVVVGMLARDAVVTSCDAAGLEYGAILGRSMQAMIVLVAIIIGIDQLGLDVAFLSVVTGIFLAAVLGSVGLAFGLGARRQVGNLLAARQLKDSLEVGDTVRIEEFEGRVTEISVTHVAIENDTATYHVPAALFDSQVAMIMKKGGSGAS